MYEQPCKTGNSPAMRILSAFQRLLDRMSGDQGSRPSLGGGATGSSGEGEEGCMHTGPRQPSVRGGELGLAFQSFGDGLANGLSFGAYDRFILPALADITGRPELGLPLSNGYKNVGEGASLFVGSSRLAYAAAARAIPFVARSAAQAVAMRNGLKGMFSLMGRAHPRTYSVGDVLARYGSEQAAIDAAGRTNSVLNGVGAGMAASGATALADGVSCE